VYIQYGTGKNKYPAKIWIEYKTDAYEEKVYTTNFYEAKSDEQVYEIVKDLIKQVRINKELLM
jgi:hypothetical protein